MAYFIETEEFDPETINILATRWTKLGSGQRPIISMAAPTALGPRSPSIFSLWPNRASVTQNVSSPVR